jgi:ComF family protein
MLCGILSHPAICDACDDAYWNETRLRCARCALPLASPVWAPDDARHRPCPVCAAQTPAFDASVVLADYAPPVDQLAMDLKFRAQLGIGREFARRLAIAVEDVTDDATGPLELLVPVPLSRARLAARGYNQAWAIARPLGRQLGVRTDARMVTRTRDTAPQASLDARERDSNVRGAFKVRGEALAGLHVGVVDDVMTSGATLDAVAAALKAAGARRVTNLVALRTPRT